MLAPEGEEEEFEFYLKFAKPLVLNLPDTNDRIKAATWLRYLKNDKTDPVLRGDYLKLLLFVLHKRKLFGPFASVPNENQPLEKFPDNVNIQEIAKNFVDVEKQMLKATLQTGGYGEWPPYTVACSSNLTEYAASQIIPNFGIQTYFAISTDPLSHWDQAEKAILPTGESLETAKPGSPVIAKVSPDISCFVSSDDSKPNPLKSPSRSPRIVIKSPKDETSPKGLGDVPPNIPKEPEKEMDDFDMDVRVPPTWGSNLVNVNEMSSVIVIQSPVRDLDIEVADEDLLDFFNDDVDLFEADIDEAASYLQGDSLVTPKRRHPTSPMTPSRTSSTDRLSASSKASICGPIGDFNIDELYEEMYKYEAIKSSRTPSPQSPRPGQLSPHRTPPPRSVKHSPSPIEDVCQPCSPKAGQLSPRKLFDALEQIATDKDMLDYYNESIDLPGDDPAFYLLGEGLTSPDMVGTSPRPSPKQKQLSPRKLFDALEQMAADKDMLDYYNESFDLPDDDPAFHLLHEGLISPEMVGPSPRPCPKAKSPKKTTPTTCPKRTIPKVSKIPKGKTIKRTIPKISKKSSTSVTSKTASVPKLSEQEKTVTNTVQQILDEINQPSISAVQAVSDFFKEQMMDISGEGLGGDSFIAPEKQDYRWLSDISPGPGLPDEEQDSALWESFGWWTDDPDEIFDYMPPSPRVRGSPEHDPYAKYRERWGDVARTPPIFSKDPKIREGMGSQRQYTIDEFGMESFEEPVWTSAEQYLKYKRDSSPFIDPRELNRQTLDLSQFPKYESPKMMQQLADFRGLPEEENIFSSDVAPDLIDVSFTDEDFRKMSRIEATMEAIRHGPLYTGLPPPTIEKTPKSEEGSWEDDKFLEETPPLFMLYPPFILTPPEYEPNPDISVDDLEDTILKYIEEDLKIINAKLPVTTPQRSPSPKRDRRPPPFFEESPPFAPDIDIEPDAYIPSPEQMPQRHVIPAQKQVAWDTNIGTPIRIKKSDAVVIQSEDDLLQKNLKRKHELATFYEQEFESPHKVPTPPPMPHLMDEPVPRRLPGAMKATKLPPSGWSWQTPTKYKQEPYVPKEKVTPTGISPPRAVSEDISIYYESPPDEALSPSMAVSSLMFSPPEGFGQGPSPIKSPGGRPMAQEFDYREYDEIDMEMLYPTEFQEYDQPELYQSPPSPDKITPERQAWRDQVEKHKGKFKPIRFDLRRRPGRKCRIKGLRKDQLAPMAETSPPEPPSRDIIQADLEQEIAALEAELFAPTPTTKPRPRDPEEISPDYERRIWQESIKLHDQQPYAKESWRVCPAPAKRQAGYKYIKPKSYAPKLETISSPVDEAKRHREDTLRRLKHQAESQVADDMAKMKAEKVDRSQYMKMMNDFDNYQRQYNIKYNWRYMKPKHPVPIPLSPPEEPISPEPPMHIFDEPVPEGQPAALLPPSGWDWKTPTKLQSKLYVPKKKVTPRGISPPRPISQEVSMFFESPPEEILSPSMAVSSLMFSPPEGFGQEPSPIKSPGGRTMPEYFSPPDMLDMAMMYPSDFDEGLDEGIAEFYDSPPIIESPSPESKAWLSQVESHEKIRFRKKDFAFRFPKSGRTYRVTRSRPPDLSPMKETSPDLRPSLETVQSEIEEEIAALEAELFPETPATVPRPRYPDDISPDYERRIWQESIKLRDKQPYAKESWRVCPAPAKRRGGYKYIKPKSYKPKLETILSPVDVAKRDREDTLRRMKHRAESQVADDMAKMKAEKVDRSQYMKVMNEFDNYQRQYNIKYNWRYMKPKHPVPIPASPPEEPMSPEPPMHIFDEPVPEGQPTALLPPSGWNWKTPSKLHIKSYVSKKTTTPTGISPPRPISQEVSMFFESPPEEILSPTMAVSSLMFSPPEDFGQEPSPIKSPGGRAMPEYFSPPDMLDMAMMYPSDFEEGLDEGMVEFYDSPPIAESPSPEKKAWRSQVESHKKTRFRKKDFVFRFPKSGRSYRVTRSRPPDLSPMKETSPVMRPSPETEQGEIEEEIAALEAVLFPETPATVPRPRYPDDISPDYERRIWQESIKLRDKQPYAKESWRVCPAPAKRRGGYKYIKPKSYTPKLETITSPVDVAKRDREDRLRRMKHHAESQVADDMAQIQMKKVDRTQYMKAMNDFDNYQRQYNIKYNWRYMKPKHPVPIPLSPPEEPVTPEPPMHIFDEPVPEGQPPALLPPSSFGYITPPHLKYRVAAERKIIKPTGSSVQFKLPPAGSLFYESPPLISPEPETPSPPKSPPVLDDCVCGKTMSKDITPPDRLNEAMLYPSDIEEGIDESTIEFYDSPPTAESPSPESKAWRSQVGTHEKTKFKEKNFAFRLPKSGRIYKVTRSRPPSLSTLVETSPDMTPQEQSSTSEENFLDAELAALEAEVFGQRSPPLREVLSPTRTPPEGSLSPPTPEYIKKAWQQELLLRENIPYHKKSFIHTKRRKYKSTQPELSAVQEKYYEWSPPSPALRPRRFEEFPRDGPLPQVTTPPENWTWRTPSPLTRLGLYAESPPLVYSPEEMSPSYYSVLSKTPTEESITITLVKKQSVTSPLRSPGGRPVLQPLHDRPLDPFEMAQIAPEDYYLLDTESPEIYDDRVPSPPVPPPRPVTPSAYHVQPRRIPRKRSRLDPNVLYASTPVSARKHYEPEVQRIRFEEPSSRPLAIRPVSPQPPPKVCYRETPIDPGMKPWKRRRKQIERTARQKLEFDEGEREFEREMMQELQAHLQAASPGAGTSRNVLGESPPIENYGLDEISMFGDLDYEPVEFNMYIADDVPQYDVRPAFENQPDVDLMDTSMIELMDELPYEQRDFRWMDSGTRCPWS